MASRLNLFIIASLAMILTGCGGVHLSLLPETKPLVEQTLEGNGDHKILLIDLDGIISFKEEQEGLIMKKPSKVAYFREALRKAEVDIDVAGVIIRINSPGDTVSASHAIYHESIRFRQK